MPAPRISQKDLLNANEMTLFTLSQDSSTLSKLTPAQLRDKITRARFAQPCARHLPPTSGAHTRFSGTKRGITGMPNERTRQKGAVMNGVVEQ